MEIIQDDERLKQIYDTGQGYIYNDFAGDSSAPDTGEWNKLHRAYCKECNPRRDRFAMTTQTSGQKIPFETSKEAFEWLMENRPDKYTKCAFCNP